MSAMSTSMPAQRSARCSPPATPRSCSDPGESDHDLISLIAHDLFGKPVPTFPDHALILLRHKFSWWSSCTLAATWASRQGSGDGVGQLNAHGCDRVRDVTLRPQRQLLWVGNLWEGQVAG